MLAQNIRLLSKCITRKSLTPNIQPKRNSGITKWVYRTEMKASAPWMYWYADGLNAFTWWWIFVHMYYQWGHIVGEFDYPEPEKWTDAELGVVSEEEL